MTLRRLPVRSVPFALAFCLAAAPSGPTEGAADDFRVVDGVLTQSLVLPDSDVAELAGSDGVVYYVDLRSLPREPFQLAAQTLVTVIGYEGERPDQIAAHVLKVWEEAPEAADDRRPADLQLIGGTVQAMSGHSLTLKSPDGRRVTVEIGNLFGGSSPLLSLGEHVQVLGVLAEDDRFAANVLILQAPIRRRERRP